MTDAHPTPARPRVLHYSHHSTGLGHLVRSLAVAGAVADRAEVVFCSGGRVPAGLTIPPGVRLVALPPIGTDERGKLTSLDLELTLEQARDHRRHQLLRCFDEVDPDAVLIELFPFGRRKFAAELLALLARARQGRRRLVVSSVRDLLVDAHPDKQHHDDEAAARLDAFFDAVIVHGDPRFARLDDTFRPVTWPDVPVYYSGFVAPSSPVVAAHPHPSQVLVSAGGGLTGGRLLAAAVEAHRSILGPMGATTRIVTGPFLPPATYAELAERASGVEGLQLERFVPDLASAMAESVVSVSQCGYNTSIDLLRTGMPAVVVPYDEGRETEQRDRAHRLASLGVVQLLPAAQLTPDALAAAVLSAIATPAAPVTLDLDGARATAALVASLLHAPTPNPTPPPTPHPTPPPTKGATHMTHQPSRCPR